MLISIYYVVTSRLGSKCNAQNTYPQKSIQTKKELYKMAVLSLSQSPRCRLLPMQGLID